MTIEPGDKLLMTDKTRICLINTPSLGKRPVSRSMAGGLGFDGNASMILPPLELAIMASQLRANGYDVTLIDADPSGLNDNEVISRVRQGSFNAAIATLSLPSLNNDCEFISGLREFVSTIAVKTMIDDEKILEEILGKSRADFIIHGECDLHIHKLIDGTSDAGTAYLEKGKVVKEDIDPVEDLDDLPVPAWDLLPFNNYSYPLMGDRVVTMQTSRGCSFSCSYYCPYPLVEGTKWRYQSPERVFNEIKRIVDQYGINKILFRDATFTLNKNRVHKVCDLIINSQLNVTWWCETRVDRLDEALLEKMRQAGCEGINIGVETGDQKVMEKQAKAGLTLQKLSDLRIKAKSLGLKLHFLLSKGFPDETRKSFVDTYELIMKLMPESLGITIMTPYPGTQLYKDALEKGWIESNKWEDYGGHQFVMHTDNLTIDDFYYGLKFLYMGNDLINKYYNGANPIEFRKVEKKLYTELLVWASGLNELQDKLSHCNSASTCLTEKGTSDSEEQLRISVIVPTFNRNEQLLSCLNDLAKQTVDPGTYEVIVIDDGSTDDTEGSLDILNYPYVLRFYRQENSGPAAARNLGVSKAENEIVAFIGDDIQVSPDFVSQHIKSHKENPDHNVAVVGHIDWPVTYNITPLMKYITGPSGLQFNFTHIRDKNNAGFGRFYTSNISLKKSFLEEEDYLFDTEFAHAALEDIELGYRLSKRGLRIIYNAEAVVYHNHPMDVRSFIKREEKVGMMSVTMGKKHPKMTDLSPQRIETIRNELKQYTPLSGEMIKAAEELEMKYYPLLKNINLEGINPGEKLEKEILYPLFKEIFQQSRNKGLLEEYETIAVEKEITRKEGNEEMVSIIIPIHNKVEYTKQCVEHLVLNTAYKPYEVIIIDNASSDGTVEFLDSLEGDVKIITNDTNLGFAMSNNQGAKVAKGKYLMFLNNDTIPQPGWLENMVKIMKERSDVAVVGSKMIYPDNTIQHAGVVFDVSDAGVHISHIYKGFDRDRKAVNHIREMNAVTAACMLVKKDFFLNNRMFDEGFLNGYEDIDFCLRVREKGLKIIYTPESELLHYEEMTEGRLSYSERNIRHFLNKWQGKIKPDIQDKAKEDGFRIEYTPDNREVYINIAVEKDLGGGSCDTDDDNSAYFRQERRDIESILPDRLGRVLDVGCGEGVLGRSLLDKGAKEVTGIELSREVCDIAKENLTDVICGDIEKLELKFNKKYFDCIIFADVLEHLKDPLSVLRKCSEYLSESGYVVASIPNVGYYAVIAMLTQGHWTYEESGILDRTHLRFFTRKEVEKLFSNAGFEITGISSHMNPVDPAYENLDDPYSGNIAFGRVELRGLTPEEIRDLFTFQYIIRAQKVGHEMKQVEKKVEDAIKSDKPEEAKQILEEYLKLHSADTDMLYKHAEICCNLGLNSEAVDSLRKILIFQPLREEATNLMNSIQINNNEYVNSERSTKNDIEIEKNNIDHKVRKVAIVRGANLNKWEMQNYEPLQDSFELTAYATNQTNFDISNIKLPVVRLPFKHQGLLMEIEGLEASLADKDLVFSADITYRFSAQAVNAKQQYGCKVVCLEWENIPYNYEEYEEVHHIKETVRNGADHFIAVTERAKEALMIEGVSEEKIDVVPMGVDLNVFKPVKDDLQEERDKLGIGRDDMVVLFIGRMVWEKGIYDFLHASARICRDSMLNEKRIRFLIVGKGPELEGARERAEALGISGSTIFIEEYPYKDMYKLHNIADLFVLPSISTRSWQEQFGMVLIESMACGTPVISTYSGSIPEVVGDAGMLCQPNDHLSLYKAMKEMISNKEHRADLGKMALERTGTVFDSANIADKVKAVFNKVMSRKTEADMLQETHDQSIEYWEKGEKEKAFTMVCEVLAKDPDNINVLNSVFRMGMELQQYKILETAIKEFLKCHPANLDTLTYLSEVFVRTGRAGQAEEELKKVLLFDPDNRRALSLIDDIRTSKKAVKI